MKTDGIFIQNLVVSYDGQKYFANPLSIIKNTLNFSDVIEIDKVPSSVSMISDIEETDEEISLKLGTIDFNLDASGNIEFKSNYYKKIGFNKTSYRGTGDKLNKDDFEKIRRDKNSALLYSVIIEYLNSVCMNNENVYNFLKMNNSTFSSLIHNSISAKNFVNMITFNLLEVEKLINSGNKRIIEEGLDKDDFELTDASKLHQVIGIPKVAINAIKDLKLEFALGQIKNLSDAIDGNNLKIFFEFIENFKILLNAYKSYYKERDIQEFIDNFTEVSKKGYRTSDLLNYLMKQNFYYSSADVFSFPFKEIMYLKDYVHMAEIYGLKVDKYPSQLKKQHDLLSKNVSSLEKMSPELEAQFKAAVDLYRDVEKDITVAYPCKKGETPVKETYSFICPCSIKDIIQEGNDLHHCVGSYSDRIINKDSRIVFMRLKGHEKESLITVDIDEFYHLKEAAGLGNCDLNDIQSKALNAWLKEISK